MLARLFRECLLRGRERSLTWPLRQQHITQSGKAKRTVSTSDAYVRRGLWETYQFGNAATAIQRDADMQTVIVTSANGQRWKKKALLESSPAIGCTERNSSKLANEFSRMNSQLAYRADLNGLRAIAIVPVVLFHLGVPGFSGGFVGVDVFFVISGFLITGIIASELDRGTFSLLFFYDRRIRRILPALAVVLAFCSVAASYIFFPDDLSQFGSTLVASAVAVSNIVFAQRTDYFAPNAELSPLLHTWSLAVEEQFYLLFPIALCAIWRWRKPWLPGAVWSVLAFSLAISIFSIVKYPTAAFYLLPSRAWELLLGSVIALELVPSPTTAWQREAGAAAGSIAILAAIGLYTRDTSFPGIAALLPCGGAFLVIWAGQDNVPTFTGRLLGGSVAVFIGLISYSLYLWHWPLIVFTKAITNGHMAPALQITLAVASVALAALTWHYIENPLRKGGWPWPTQRDRLIGTGLILSVFVLAGVALKGLHGFPERMPPAVRDLYAKNEDFSKRRKQCHFDGSARGTFSKTCVIGAPVPPRFIVFADSHGAEVSLALGEISKARHMSVRQVTASGCPPALGFNTKQRPQCAEYVHAMLRSLLKQPPSTVLTTAYFSEWAESPNASDFWNGFEEVVRSLRSAGHSVVILGDVPSHPGRIRIPTALARWVYQGGAAETYRFSLDRQMASSINRHLERIAKANGAAYVPLARYFCPDGRECRGYIDGAVMYFDDDHISVSGAQKIVADVLAPILWPLPSDAANSTQSAPEPRMR